MLTTFHVKPDFKWNAAYTYFIFRTNFDRDSFTCAYGHRTCARNRSAYSRRCITLTAFRYSLPVLKIYSARYVYYKFSVLAVNIGTQPLMTDFVTSIVVNFND